MALDPTISLRVGQGVTPPANPLATIGQFAGVANSLDQNRLINQAVLNQQQQNVGMRQDQGLKSLTATNQILAGLLNNPDLKAGKPITDTIIGSVLQAGQMGLLPPNAIKAALANVPGDAAGQQAWLKGHYDQSEALLGRAGANTFGTGGNMVNGQQIQPGVVLPPRLGGGFVPSGAPTQVYPSRGELNQRIIVGYDAKSNPIYGPAAIVTPPNLGGPAVGGGAVGDGRYPTVPPALRNPNGQTAGGGPLPLPPPVPPGAPPAAPGGAPANPYLVTAPGPAKTAALTETGGASAKAFQDIAAQGVTAKSQLSTLGTMLADANQFIPGPGAENLKNVKASIARVAQSVGINPETLGISSDKIGAQESFNKLVAQLADAQGAGSDARLAVNQHANPNVSLSLKGVQTILRQLQGNADYLNARARLAAAYPDKSDRAGFEDQIARHLDPRAFQLQRMTPDQRGTYFTNLPPQDRAAVKNAYIWAQEHNLLGQ